MTPPWVSLLARSQVSVPYLTGAFLVELPTVAHGVYESFDASADFLAYLQNLVKKSESDASCTRKKLKVLEN